MYEHLRFSYVRHTLDLECSSSRRLMLRTTLPVQWGSLCCSSVVAHVACFLLCHRCGVPGSSGHIWYLPLAYLTFTFTMWRDALTVSIIASASYGLPYLLTNAQSDSVPRVGALALSVAMLFTFQGARCAGCEPLTFIAFFFFISLSLSIL